MKLDPQSYQAKELKDVVFVVEASDFEVHALWQETKSKVKWDGRNRHGFIETVGHVAGHPVCMSVHFDKINGHKVLFYTATSRFVDWDMLKAWLDENCNPKEPGSDRPARTNASNFHICLQALRKLSEDAQATQETLAA